MTSRKIGNLRFTNLNILFAIAGILVFVFLGNIFYTVYQSDRTLMSFMIIPLILGIIFENRRLSSDWKTIFLIIIGSLLLSVFAFMPDREERRYNFENHIEIWPYYFIVFFVLISIFHHQKKVIPKLTEGVTLLQSISIIYWILDIGFLNLSNFTSYLLFAIGIIFSIFSFIHAFSYLKLHRNSRLFLSIWSSIIMLIFAIEYIYRVFNFNYFVEYKTLNEFLNFLQYFLLGVSLIYIFQNALMLLVYFPSRNHFYDREHIRDIKKMNKKHIERYSQNQIKILDSFIALILLSVIYYLNYRFQIIPRYTMIWLVFWLFPFIILIKKKLSNYKVNSIKDNL